MARKVYRVQYLTTRTMWEVRHEGNTLSSLFTKEAAVTEGTKVAKANQPSQLVVHKQDGTFDYEYTYGDDPYPPKG